MRNTIPSVVWNKSYSNYHKEPLPLRLSEAEIYSASQIKPVNALEEILVSAVNILLRQRKSALTILKGEE